MKALILFFGLSTSICLSQNTFTFPFDGNDKWVYDEYSAFSDFPIFRASYQLGKDTLMPNNQTYKYFMSLYLRKDGSKIYQFASADSSEFIRYDFSKSVGDTFSDYRVNKYFFPIALVGDSNMPVFDQTRRVLSFSGGLISDDIADSIGIISLNAGTDSWYSLVGAVISGRTYGDVTLIAHHDKLIPLQADLSQNYPNPFNPSTVIQYDVHQALNVKITITNEIGQQTAVLVDGYKLPGSYRVEWNASGYSSGIYYCTMRSGSFLRTTKLALLK